MSATRGLPPAGPPFLKYNVIDLARQLEGRKRCAGRDAHRR